MRKTVSSTSQVLEAWRNSKWYERIKQHDPTDTPSAYLDERTVYIWRHYSPAAIIYALEVAYQKTEHGVLFGETWDEIWRYTAGVMKNYDADLRETRAALDAAIESERPSVFDQMFGGDHE